MLKRIKRLFLVIPMLACLFTVSSINQVNANSVAANVNKTIATPLTIITDNTSTNNDTNNDLANGLNSLPTQIQEQVNPQLAEGTIDTYKFYLFGCFYSLSIERDDEGEITCEIFGMVCGNELFVHAVGDGCSEN